MRIAWHGHTERTGQTAETDPDRPNIALGLAVWRRRVTRGGRRLDGPTFSTEVPHRGGKLDARDVEHHRRGGAARLHCRSGARRRQDEGRHQAEGHKHHHDK